MLNCASLIQCCVHIITKLIRIQTLHGTVSQEHKHIMVLYHRSTNTCKNSICICLGLLSECEVNPLVLTPGEGPRVWIELDQDVRNKLCWPDSCVCRAACVWWREFTPHERTGTLTTVEFSHVHSHYCQQTSGVCVPHTARVIMVVRWMALLRYVLWQYVECFILYVCVYV